MGKKDKRNESTIKSNSNYSKGLYLFLVFPFCLTYPIVITLKNKKCDVSAKNYRSTHILLLTCYCKKNYK